jgi:DNA-binding NarL/FixJ family response regulator
MAPPIRLALVTARGELEQRVTAALGSAFEVSPAVETVGLLRDTLEGVDVLLVEAAAPVNAERTELRSLASERPLLIASETADEKAVRRALAIGAAGVIRLGDLEISLEPALRAALAGLVCYPNEVRSPSVKPVLTTREKQILGMVVLGMSNADIARRLFVAESTVKSHLSVAYGKLGVRSRNEAARVILDPADGYGIGILHISDPAASS